MSPLVRQGIAVPRSLTHESVRWFSSNVAKVLPVLASRWNARLRKTSLVELSV